MRVNFAKIGQGPFPDRGYPEGEKPDTISENQCDAQIVLRNWITASAWGLPRSMIVDLLEMEAKRLLGENEI